MGDKNTYPEVSLENRQQAEEAGTIFVKLSIAIDNHAWF
jgi:hypothetical protein